MLLIMFVGCNDSSKTETTKMEDSTSPADHTHVKIDSPNVAKNPMTGMMDMANTIKPSGNIDVDFANLMMVHHLGAVNMIRMQDTRSQDPEVKALASQMLKTQDKEINAFQKFLANNKSTGSDTAFFNRLMGTMHNMKADIDDSASADVRFMEMMIPHHRSGIAMALLYLQKEEGNADLKKIASDIVSSQKREILTMQRLLKKS